MSEGGRLSGEIDASSAVASNDSVVMRFIDVSGLRVIGSFEFVPSFVVLSSHSNPHAQFIRSRCTHYTAPRTMNTWPTT